MNAMRGLGRGFDSLIPTDYVDEEFDVTAVEDAKSSKLRELKLTEVEPDEGQPRRYFGGVELEALAASIKEHGVLQPIVVVANDDKYTIVAGERRWRASKLAGLETIPAIVRTLTDQNRLELSLIENVQREDLNAIEIATAYAKLKTQFNLTSKQIAQKVGKSESAVINTMRLLNLPDDAKRIMVEKGLPEGVMRPLVTVDPAIIAEVMPRIVEEEWSSRKVENFLTALKTKGQAKHRGGKAVSSSYTDEANALTTKFDLPVEIRVSARGSGKVVLSFKNERELKKLLKMF